MLIFMVLNINFKKIPFIVFFITDFYETFIKFINIFPPLKIIYWQLLWRCQNIQIIYMPIFKIWRFFIFILIFHIFIIRFEYWLIEWHISILIPFSTINSISVSVNNSNFTSVFSKAACQANPGAEKYFAGS